MFGLKYFLVLDDREEFRTDYVSNVCSQDWEIKRAKLVIASLTQLSAHYKKITGAYNGT